MALLRMIRRLLGLFVACMLAAVAPIIGPLLFRAVVLYFVGTVSHGRLVSDLTSPFVRIIFVHGAPLVFIGGEWHAIRHGWNLRLPPGSVGLHHRCAGGGMGQRCAAAAPCSIRAEGRLCFLKVFRAVIAKVVTIRTAGPIRSPAPCSPDSHLRPWRFAHRLVLLRWPPQEGRSST